MLLTKRRTDYNQRKFQQRPHQNNMQIESDDAFPEINTFQGQLKTLRSLDHPTGNVILLPALLLIKLNYFAKNQQIFYFSKVDIMNSHTIKKISLVSHNLQLFMISQQMIMLVYSRN